MEIEAIPPSPLSSSSSSSSSPSSLYGSNDSYNKNMKANPQKKIQHLKKKNSKSLLSPKQLYLFFVLMGAGVLFPYNALLSSSDYFAQTHSEEADVAGQLAASCLTALLITTLMLLPLSSPSSSADGGKNNMVDILSNPWKSPSKRILTGFLLSTALLFLLSVSLFYKKGNLSMTSLNIIASLFGIADAVSQSGLYVLAAKYHNPAFSAAVTFGSATSGLLVTVLSLITRAFFAHMIHNDDNNTENKEGGEEEESLRQGCALLFGICTIVILSCVYSLFRVMADWCARGGSWDNTHADKEASSLSPVEQQQGESVNERSPVLLHLHHTTNESVEVGNGNGDDSVSSIELPNFHTNYSDYSNVHHDDDDDEKVIKSTLSNTIQYRTNKPFKPTTLYNNKIYKQFTNHPKIQIYIATLSKTWKPTLSMFLNYFVTLSLFPGTIASIQSSSVEGKFQLGSWLTIVLLAVFNGADMIGRYILNVECGGLASLLLQEEVVLEEEEDEYNNNGCRRENDCDGGDVMLNEDILPGTHDITKKNDEQDVENANKAFATTTTSLHTGNKVKQQKRKHHPNYNILVWYQTLLRFLFFPIIAYCILPPIFQKASTTATPFISSDIIRCILVFIFGITNGFITCANFMITPTMVTREEERDASSFLLLLALYSGLTCGAYFGLVVDLFLTWCKGG